MKEDLKTDGDCRSFIISASNTIFSQRYITAALLYKSKTKDLNVRKNSNICSNCNIYFTDFTLAFQAVDGIKQLDCGMNHRIIYIEKDL